MSEKYKPWDENERETFMGCFCDYCAHYTPGDDEQCDILSRTRIFAVNHAHYPDEWTFDDTGEPVCTNFSDCSDPVKHHCSRTIDLFGGGV